MGSRTGDGSAYHDTYDISIQINGLETYRFPNVALEQDAPNSLAVALAQTPATGSAVATQPLYATTMAQSAPRPCGRRWLRPSIRPPCIRRIRRGIALCAASDWRH